VTRGYATIGLHMPKTPANVGHVLRAASAFDVASVYVSGTRYRRSGTDTSAAYRHLPLIEVTDLHSIVPYDCVPVAVELTDDARPISTFIHPERAMYIFGPEDSSLGQKVTGWCRDVIYVPTAHCLNLAACVNVVLFHRAMQRNEWPADAPVIRHQRATA
jgi:tRNA(Leu) C34 or U34 (ribose-2'-O)-methylase TrmL